MRFESWISSGTTQNSLKIHYINISYAARMRLFYLPTWQLVVVITFLIRLTSGVVGFLGSHDDRHGGRSHGSGLPDRQGPRRPRAASDILRRLLIVSSDKGDGRRVVQSLADGIHHFLFPKKLCTIASIFLACFLSRIQYLSH